MISKRQGINAFKEPLLITSAGIATMLVLSPFTASNPLKWQAAIWFAYLAMILTVHFRLKYKNRNWHYYGLGLSSKSWKWLLFTMLKAMLVFVLATAAFVISGLVFSDLLNAANTKQQSSYNYLEGNIFIFIPTLLAVYFVSSFGEELIFRAVIIKHMIASGKESRFIKIVAVLFSSCLFGLAHYQWGLSGIIQTGFMGLVLAIAFLINQKNLWINVLAHACMDTLLLWQMYAT